MSDIIIIDEPKPLTLKTRYVMRERFLRKYKKELETVKPIIVYSKFHKDYSDKL
jgi:hypothetical protein